MSGSTGSTSTYRTTIPIGPLVDTRTGRIMPDWLIFLNQIFKRSGAEAGSNAVASQDASETTQDQVTALQGTVTMQAAQINALNTEIAAQANTITALQASLASAQSAAATAQDAALIALFSE